NQDDWFVCETLGMLRRTFARLEVSSRSLYAVAKPESCFVGTLLELLLAADRSYMLHADEDGPQTALALSDMNLGALPTVAGMTRLEAKQLTPEQARVVSDHKNRSIGPAEALSYGLVTATPDSLDWEDELRQAIETRTAISPDALTGLEANLRFALPETQGTRVFGR